MTIGELLEKLAPFMDETEIKVGVKEIVGVKYIPPTKYLPAEICLEVKC
jgi:hypothetical protein